MDIKSLRYFYATAQALSFTQAAKAMHVVQPAISMAVKKLEEELSLTLFHRYDRKIALTDEGRILLGHCQRIFQAIDDAKVEMDELRGLTKGEVRVGIPNMLGSYYFPEIFMAFRKAYPSLTVSVTEGGASDLQQQLEQGKLDVTMLVAASASPSLMTQTIIKEPMMVIMPTDHPLAQHSAVDVEQFFAHNLILFKHGYFHRNLVDRLAKEHKMPLKISFETNILQLMKSMVVANEGLTTLLPRVIQDTPALTARPFTTSVELNLSIAWRKEGYLSVANQTFIDFLLNEGRQLIHQPSNS
ncbi:MAG: LysR family transcriptional regulator [Pontibacterium sp.]